MKATQQDLDGFYSFATRRLPSAVKDLSFDELVVEWESLQDRGNVNAAIREGLADVDAGRHQTAE